MLPVKTSLEAKYEEDLIKFYADHYDNIIWEKVEDSEETKKIVEMYMEDTSKLDLDRPMPKPVIEKVNETQNLEPIKLEFETTAKDLVE